MTTPSTETRRPLGWHLGLSAYWFAVSLKWFVLLTAVINEQVEALVPGEEKARYWGLVLMVGAFWAVIGPGLFGYISDRTESRCGKWKPYLAIGTAMTVIALMVLGTATSVWVIVVGYLLLQLSDDVAQGPYSALIPALVSKEERGLSSGILGMLRQIAQVFGAVGAFLIAMFGMGVIAIYVFIALINVICALITLLTVREERPPRQGKTQSFLPAWLEPWKDPDFRWIWGTRFLVALGFYLVYHYLRFFLVDVVQDFTFFGIAIAPVDPALEGEERARAISQAATMAVFVLALLISVVSAISAVVFGRMADKIGRKRVVLITGSIMALVMIPFILFPNYTILVFLAMIFGVGYGGYESATWALVSDIMPSQDDLAKDMGIWQASIATPQIFSGSVGFLVDIGEASQTGMGYTIAFSFAALAFFAGTLLIRRVRGST